MGTSDASDTGKSDFFESTCPKCHTYINMAIPRSVPMTGHFTCPGCGGNLYIGNYSPGSTAQHNLAPTPRPQVKGKFYF